MALRIESCSIEAFGPLSDLELDGLDRSVVVLEGRNEAGKTAFFHFLQTIFYGIYPTDASKHPYAPRSGRPLKGSLRFRLTNGTTYTVTRRLRSSPLGQLHEADGDSERLRNRNVPAVEHVPQEVYESVYALQLDDMVQLEGQAWDEIQDRLLGTMSVDHLRPAREVIEELEDEATDLWRTDNRGKPEAKQLEQRRRDLREAAREARERETEVRRLQDEIAEHEQRIDELKEEKVNLAAEQRRAQRLKPVHDLLQQIAHFEERAGDPAEYDDLPDAPTDRLEALNDEIEQLESRVQQKREEIDALEEDREAFTDGDERVLDREDDIRGWGRRVERYEKEKADLEAARREVEAAERRLEDAARVLSEGWDEEVSGAVRDLSLAVLRERIKAYAEAARDLRETQARAETVGLQVQARKSLVPWIAVAAIGLAAAVIGLVVSLPIAGVPVAAGAVAAVGVLQAVAAWQHNRRLEVQREQLELDDEKAEAEARADQVEQLLDGLPLPAERLVDPEMDLYTDLQALKEAVREREEAQETAKDLEVELEEARTQLRFLGKECGVFEERSDRSVPAVVAALERRLATAQERDEAGAAAQEQLPEVRSGLDALTDRLAERREERTELKRHLEALGDGNLEAGVAELKLRRTAARRAEMSRDRLHTEHPDWKECRGEIEALEEEGEWRYSDEEQARIEQRLETINEKIREQDKRKTEKEKDVEHYQEQRTVADVESELAYVERRLGEVQEERDRRMLLAGIVREADAEFRRKHQPDVLRRASDYLGSVTGGRYERLSINEPENQLVVFEEEDGLPRPVGPPLSQGTLDQIYLSLRLAIIDHLDADGEHLPVVLDEVFVNWDPERRKAGFDLLAGMAEERQIFFFTCHPHFAEEVTHHLDAEHLDLAALRDGEPTQAELSFD